MEQLRIRQVRLLQFTYIFDGGGGIRHSSGWNETRDFIFVWWIDRNLFQFLWLHNSKMAVWCFCDSTLQGCLQEHWLYVLSWCNPGNGNKNVNAISKNFISSNQAWNSDSVCFQQFPTPVANLNVFMCRNNIMSRPWQNLLFFFPILLFF